MSLRRPSRGSVFRRVLRQGELNEIREESFHCWCSPLSLLILAACSQKSNCNGISFGTSGSGGSGAGGVNSGGSVCGSGSNSGGDRARFPLLPADRQYPEHGDRLTARPSRPAWQPGSFRLGSGRGFRHGRGEQSFPVPDMAAPGWNRGQVLAFSINHSNGSLTPLSGNPFSTGMSKADTIVADPQGRYHGGGQ